MVVIDKSRREESSNSAGWRRVVRFQVLCWVLVFAAVVSAQAQTSLPAPMLSNMGSNRSSAPTGPSAGSSAAAPIVPKMESSVSAMGAGGQLLSALDATYQICPQDVVEVQVFGQTTMNAVTRVDSRGALNFPPIGLVQASDLNERQLEAVLEDRLRKGYLVDPHVSVYVREMHPREVAIIGEIKIPGRYPYLFGCRSMVEILARAGGMTDKAGGTAYIIRFTDPQWVAAADLPSSSALAAAIGQPGVQRLAVDLNDLLINGKNGQNVALKPGDIVTIPDAGYIHVTGDGIEKPGVFPLRRMPNSLEQFIDEAGGLKFEASKIITLVHGETGGQAGKIEKIDYKKLRKKKVDEVFLRPGDKVVVDTTMPKLILARVTDGVLKVVNIGAYFSIPLGSNTK